MRSVVKTAQGPPSSCQMAVPTLGGVTPSKLAHWQNSFDHSVLRVAVSPLKRMDSSSVGWPVAGSKRTTKVSYACLNGTISSVVSSSTACQRTRGSARKTAGIEVVSAHRPRLPACAVCALPSLLGHGSSMRLTPSRWDSLTLKTGRPNQVA
jgi:hypothetical protein